MHETAMDSGRLFFENYWRPSFKRILDVGSKDENGSLRGVAPQDAIFFGVDMSPGNGVDLVLSDPHAYPFPDDQFDVVISTSCYEHDPMFWLTFLEGIRVLAPHGFLYFNAPSGGTYHGYPLDHWRFYPDAGIGLEMWARRMKQPVRMIESFMTGWFTGGFNDFSAVFTKDPDFVPAQYIQDVPRPYLVCNARKGVVEPFEANAKTLLHREHQLRRFP